MGRDFTPAPTKLLKGKNSIMLDNNTDLSTNYKIKRNDCLLLILKYFNTTKEELTKPVRLRLYTHRRFLAAWIMRDCTNASLNQISALMGYKHHSSVLCGIKTLKKRPEYKSKYLFLRDYVLAQGRAV